MPTHTQLVPQPTFEIDHRQERIIFLGTPAISVPTLEALAASALRPIAVIAEPDKPVGRGQQLTAPAVKQAAERLGLPISQPRTADELLHLVATLEPTLGIVVAYGRILTTELLALPAHGFVNLHFSLLPRYRGATPIQAAILNGDAQTGVTLMQIDPGLDTGPILGYAPSPIEPTETTGQLATRLAEIAASLATTLLPDYLAGRLHPEPQSASPTPVTRRLSKEDGRINWAWPADQLERFIRAMDPWPRAWCELADLRIMLHRAHLENHQLLIDVLQVAGGRPISYAEFGRGYPAALTALRKVCPSIHVEQ